MAEFKQMPKMMTNEPTVILKLKKGGHVASEHKDADGHTNMKGKAFMSSKAEEAAEDGCAPKKPSMSERRKAMSGALLNSKKGGKAEKKAMGGPMGAPMGAPGAAMDPRKAALLRAMMAKRGAPAAPMAAPAGGLPAMKKGGKMGDEAQDKAMIKKAFKEHDAQEHKGDKGTKLKLKAGGVSKYANTKMHDGDKKDKAHGTGDVKEGKPAGYKTGGTIEGNEGKFAKTKVDDGSKTDKAHGTGEVKEGKPAGYKKGGTIAWENRPANDGDRFDSAHGTAGVKESNAGGYKKGGAAKKHFATGGSVNNAGRAVAMPHHFVSEPISNTRQSGTFKKGGKVRAKHHYDDGGKVEDASKGAYDRALQPEGMSIANAIRNAPGNAVGAMKRLLGMGDKPAK